MLSIRINRNEYTGRWGVEVRQKVLFGKTPSKLETAVWKAVNKLADGALDAGLGVVVIGHNFCYNGGPACGTTTDIHFGDHRPG